MPGTLRALVPAALCLTLLVGCSAADDSAESAKNGDAPPTASRAPAPQLPVPSGKGSKLPDDLNGDGHRDLVLNDLVKDPKDSHGDDAGIGIVYGTAGPRALDPAVHRLLTVRQNAAATEGALPAAFDAEVSCDLDGDGFADLVVTTDPPYDGVGRPPVPLQLLFGSPKGIGGKAVVLKIPERARYGDEWPDNPVCGDFDGDGSADLAITASAGRISYLRGPFTRAGAPKAAGAPLPDGGAALAVPAGDADINDDGYDDLVITERPPRVGQAFRGTVLLGGPQGPGKAGGTYGTKALKPPGEPPLADGVTDFLRYADFDGDRRRDVVTRTHQDERVDVVAVYGTKRKGTKPLLTFSTAIFLR
ncbi:FG-GAP repeat domain-containing protein [Streptomyces albipurpureus]|uniref:VCBS repeat-containing protein n=1 Tax=Streptomyces albipurpureus TaxID=2897419 RepID=A0ABT0USU9_9ACTN|nr:VCBS repeat-containing protein [Streptomyces sp. CWNU-1]MCM2391311.1 VCBS repeat-containing protein [Streptomyces sp. CWNU-1]